MRHSIAQRIAAARLERQFLVGTSPHKSAADVVRALGAVQSQDYAGAKWAVGMRAQGLTEADVDQAYDNGDILRTHVLRPTWHFVAPEDLPWKLALTGPRVAAVMASYGRKLGLDDKIYRKSHKVIEKALEEHGHLTRQQLKVALDRARIVTDGTQRLARLVMQAELDAVICSGPRVGKQISYALVSKRAPKSRELDRDEALLEITRRYFPSRAPASVHDFAWWSGLTIGDCKRAIEIAGSDLETVTLDGKDYHVPADFELPAKPLSSAHLLPNYDEYFIGFKDRSAIGQRIRSSALVTGGNALIAYVVAIDGQLVGGFKRLAIGGDSVVEFNIVVTLTRSERARVNSAIAQYSRFLGQDVIVRNL